MKLESHKLLSTFAFNFNLRRYSVALRLLLVFFPHGLGAPGAMPDINAVGEACVLATGALVGALNFGPQAGKQVRGGMTAFHQMTGQASAAAEFLGKVGIKMVFDIMGLAGGLLRTNTRQTLNLLLLHGGQGGSLVPPHVR